MFKNNLKNFLTPALILILSGVFFLYSNVQAVDWTDPTLTAPNGNTLEPINVGSSPQTKIGSFAVSSVVIGTYGISSSTPNGLFVSGNVGIGTTTVSTIPLIFASHSGATGISLGKNYLTGGRISGLIAPINNDDAANKFYVDQTITSNISASSLWKFSGSTLYASTTSWNVGIGTTTTSMKFDVNGKARISTGLIVPKIYPSADSASAFQINKADGTTNVFDVDTSNLRVGIGTTAPTEKLHVYSTDSSTNILIDSAYNSLNAKTNILFMTDTGSYYHNRAEISGYEPADELGGTLEFKTADATATLQSRMLINRNGYVGIGSTTPGVLLSLNPGANIVGLSLGGGKINGLAMPIYNNEAANKQYVDQTITANISGTSPWKLSGSNLYASSTSWSIGIGTNSPGAKLDIAGGNLDLDNTTFANQFGVISKNGTRFIHDFNYGNNGTVTTTGNNTFVGLNSGNLTMGSTATQVYHASGNTGVGANVLTANTTGYYNTALGINSLNANTTGSNNAAFGFYALSANNTGSQNSALGSGAISSNTSGTANTGVGNNSLYANTTGGNNTAMGYGSLYSNKTGSQGVAVGYYAQYYANDTATPWTNYNTAVGYQSLKGSATAANNTGNYNTAIGYQSLLNNTSGASNTVLGYLSSSNNTTGIQNMAIGATTLVDNQTGSYNAAIGGGALQHTTSSFNTAVGALALQDNIGGAENTAVGTGALTTNTSGSYNVALGRNAGRFITGGSISNLTSASSVYLGYGTMALASGDTNEIVIGYNATGIGNNSVVLGNDSVTKTVLKGNVGLASTTPAYLLGLEAMNGALVSSSTNVMAIGNGNRIVGLSNLPLTSSEATSKFYVDSAVGALATVAKYATSTTATYDGSRGGYTAANALCSAQAPGSHVCTAGEILYTINAGLTATIPFNSTLWVTTGPPGFTANANDCLGWTSNTATDYGAVWIKFASGDGLGSLNACNVARKYACCK